MLFASGGLVVANVYRGPHPAGKRSHASLGNVLLVLRSIIRNPFPQITFIVPDMTRSYARKSEVVDDDTPFGTMPPVSYLTGDSAMPNPSASATLDFDHNSGTARLPLPPYLRERDSGTYLSQPQMPTTNRPSASGGGPGTTVTRAEDPSNVSYGGIPATQAEKPMESHDPETSHSTFNMSWVQPGPDDKIRTVAYHFTVPVPPSIRDPNHSAIADWAGNLVSKVDQGIADRWQNLQLCSPEARGSMLEAYPFNHAFNLLHEANAKVDIGEWPRKSDSSSSSYHSSCPTCRERACTCDGTGTQLLIYHPDGKTHQHVHMSAGSIAEYHPRRSSLGSHEQQRQQSASLTSRSAAPTSLYPSALDNPQERQPPSGYSTGRFRLPPVTEGQVDGPRSSLDQGIYSAPEQTDGEKSAQLIRTIRDLVDEGKLILADNHSLDDITHGAITSRVLSSRHPGSREAARYDSPTGDMTSEYRFRPTEETQEARNPFAQSRSPLPSHLPASGLSRRTLGVRGQERTPA